MRAKHAMQTLGALGAHASSVLEVSGIPRSSAFLAACRQNRCGSFAKNWACPPAESGKAFEEAASRAAGAVVFQYTAVLQDTFDAEGMADAQRAFEALCAAAVEAIPDSIVFGTGPCSACAVCTYPEPCRRGTPRHNLEAAGVDVTKLCNAAQLPYAAATPSVTYTGLLLLSQEPADEERPVRDQPLQ